MSRLILVSNRLPFTLRKQARKTMLVRSTGGLVAGLGPVHDASDTLWIGNLGVGSVLDAKRRDQLRRHRLVPITLPREKARRHYEGFSNGVLWPLCHYFLESVSFDPADFEAYRWVNQKFADVIEEHARPGDRIWVHDYHLMLLPSMIRKRLRDVRIGFFMHIPIPSSEVFRVLPVADEILEGLIGSDLIGVHTYDYARHLTTAYRRILGRRIEQGAVEWEGGRCQVRVHSLGVDAEEFARLGASQEVVQRLAKWRRRVGGRKVVLGVDRLDYSKGIPLRLEAYRRLLASEPKWRDKVVFIQLAVPSRSSIPQYRSLKNQVERMVGEINGEFSDLGMMPLHYMHRSVPREELVALYRLADVAVVTPLRDGMNLVAKEYIASRPANDGALVLSEFAGAASEMGEALVVNPWDLNGTVRALDRALRMGADEREARMAALKCRVQENTAQGWARRFLEELDACPRPSVVVESPDWSKTLVADFASARSRVLVLAYDGTLGGFDAEPAAAKPDPSLLGLLGRLASAPRTRLVIMSGREPGWLQRWFGDLPVDLLAEHGLYLRPRGGTQWEDLAPGTDRSWMPVVEEVMASYVARTPGSFIERKKAGLAWHYRKAEGELGVRQGRELAHHLTEFFANRPVRILRGACVVEVISQGIDKGRAYRTVVRRMGNFNFILAAGDDRTDEDLFRAVEPEAWSIKIGEGMTAARHRLPSPEKLRDLLGRGLEAQGHRSSAGGRRGASSPDREDKAVAAPAGPPDRVDLT